MRARSVPLLAVLLVASVVGAADPETEPIRLPSAPAVIPPPGSTVRLTAEILYVVDSDIPILVYGSPDGILKITKEPGPLKIRGKFSGGLGKVETRTFNGKYLAIVEPAVKNGVAEFLIVPVGSKSEGETIRRTIEVVDGTGPIPPPEPKPPDPKPPDPKPPDPKPPDPKPEPTTSFRVIFCYESADTLTKEQNSVIYGKTVSDYLNANCTKENGLAGWRRYDQNTTAANETPVMKQLWGAVKPALTTLPSVAIERNTKVEILPLSATPEEQVKVFESYVNKGK